MKIGKKKGSRSWAAIKWVGRYYLVKITMGYVTRIACCVGAVFVAWHQMPPPKDRNVAPIIPPGDGLMYNGIRIAVTYGPTGPSSYLSTGTANYPIEGGPTGPDGPVIGPISF
jgi:hypothetical protein